MPDTAILFPRCLSADQAACPDFPASDAGAVFCARSSNRRVALEAGRVTAQSHFLRCLHVSTHGPAPPSLRLASTASATTYTSSLHHSDDTCSIRGVDSGYAMGFSSDDYQTASQYALPLSDPPHTPLQQVARPFSKKRSADLPSLNSVASLPSSPVTPNTPLFASNPAITDLTTRPLPNVGSYSNVSRANHARGGSITRSSQEEKPKVLARLRRKSRDIRPENEQSSPFHPNVNLTPQQLQRSRELHVLDGEGRKVRFGDLWEGQRTCALFIRHFWCASCMDYMRSIKEQVDPDVLNKAGVRLVVISNGSPGMIKSYSSIFSFPFPLYTDPSCALYHTLGMTLRTTDAGPDSERGDYIRHGATSGIAMVMKNAFKMPLHKNVGDIKQLGGEFVFGPGFRCSFVSRMHNTRSHAPVKDVLSAAGVQLGLYPEATPHTSFYDNEEQWMKDRDTELKRIQARKGMRRGYIGEYRDSESSDLDGCLDVWPIPHERGVVRELGYIKERPDYSEPDYDRV